jgi:hypothetical protein
MRNKERGDRTASKLMNTSQIIDLPKIDQIESFGEKHKK